MSPALSSAKVQEWLNSSGGPQDMAGKRVVTQFAREFYHGGLQDEQEGGEGEGIENQRMVTQAGKEISQGGAQDGQQGAEGEDDGSGVDEVGTAMETIAELKEQNKRLLEMMNGFAKKIEALEGKASNGNA
jgi:hypothetical protein